MTVRYGRNIQNKLRKEKFLIGFLQLVNLLTVAEISYYYYW